MDWYLENCPIPKIEENEVVLESVVCGILKFWLENLNPKPLFGESEEWIEGEVAICCKTSHCYENYAEYLFYFKDMEVR